MLRVGYLHNLFEILLYRTFVSSAFISLCNHLFILVWSHGYLFYTLGYNPILYFVQIIPALALFPLGALLLGTCVPLMYLHLFFLSTSLLSGITRCSRLIVYISCLVLESAIF